MSVLINFLKKIKIKNILLFFLIIFIITILLYYYYFHTNNKNLNQPSTNRNSNDKKGTTKKLNNNNNNNINKVYSSSTYINNINYFSNMNNFNNPNNQNLKLIPEKYNEHIIKMRIMKNKIKNLMSRNNINGDIAANSNNNKNLNNIEHFLLNKTTFLTSHVHLFYYHPINWYKTVPNTTEKILNVNFYPYYGLYNETTNSEIFYKHLNFIKNSGINCIVLTVDDKNYKKNQQLIQMLNKLNINFTLQIDNYENRTIQTIQTILEYFVKLENRNFLKIYSLKYKQYLPIIYIKFISDIDEINWKLFFYDKNKNYYSLNNKIISTNSNNNLTTIRDTNLNCLFIGQIVHADDKFIIKKSNFDGFYTLLPSNGATYSSTWKNWSILKKFSDSYNLIFVPTIGPGYDDNKKQPKNGVLRRHRSAGNYYGVAWRTAISLNPSFITISSFNNWVEGTQIEPAIPKTGFKDYLPAKPTKYLEITKQYVYDYIKIKNQTVIDNLKTLKCKDFFNLTVC